MEEKVRNVIISKSIIQTYPECLVEWELVGEDHRLENMIFECPCRRYKLKNTFFWLNSETLQNIPLGGTCQTHMRNDYEVEQKKPKQKKNDDEPPKSKEDYVFSDDGIANLINHFTRRVKLIQKQHKSQRDYYHTLKQLKRYVFELGIKYLQPIYEEVYELNEEIKREEREIWEREQRKLKEEQERIEREEKERLERMEKRRLEREKEQLERDEKEQLERDRRKQLEREKQQKERIERIEYYEREKKRRLEYDKQKQLEREKQEKEEEEAHRKLCVVMKQKIYTFKEKYPRDTWVQYFKNNNMNNKNCDELTEILWEDEVPEVEIFRQEVRDEIIKLPDYIRVELGKQNGFYGIWGKPDHKEKMKLKNFFGNMEEKPPKKILRN